MAVLVWDDRSYKLYLRVRPDETYTPTEEVNTLVSEAEAISQEYAALAEKLTILFDKCTNWNLANDSTFATNYEAHQQKQKSQGRFVKKKS